MNYYQLQIAVFFKDTKELLKLFTAVRADNKLSKDEVAKIADKIIIEELEKNKIPLDKMLNYNMVVVEGELDYGN